MEIKEDSSQKCQCLRASTSEGLVPHQSRVQSLAKLENRLNFNLGTLPWPFFTMSLSIGPRVVCVRMGFLKVHSVEG